MESILISIKKLLGITEDDIYFDTEIIIHINSVFSTLNDLGVGPAKTFGINDDKPIWTDFTGEDNDYQDVKTYVYLKVRMLFDPPASSSVITAMEKQISEYEWRLTVRASNTSTEENSDDEE